MRMNQARGTSAERRIASLILLGVCIMLVAGSSGCIDIYYAKALLYNPPAKEVQYAIRAKGALSYVWDIDLISVISNPLLLVKESENSTNVANGTQFLVVDYNVEFMEIPDSIRNYSLPYLPPRYFELSLLNPEGKDFWNVQTNETSHGSSGKIMTPQAGKWIIKVKALGYGSSMPNFQDSFSVTVTVKEPK